MSLVPVLAPGIELPEPGADPAVASLPPGRLVRVSAETLRLLALVDGRRDLEEIAALLTAAGPPIDANSLRTVFDRTLVPAGLASFEGAARLRPPPGSRLWLRVPLLPAAAVRALARPLAPLFRPWIAAGLALFIPAAFAAFAAGHRGAALARAGFGTRAWMGGGLIVLAASILHELGHAAGLLAAGESPGVIGAGMFGVLPVLFNDISRIWRLPARRRIAVDLGGVYIQLLFAAVLAATGAAERIPGGPRAILAIGVISLVNLLPLFRFDGHWILADLREHRARAGGRSGAGEAPRARQSLPRVRRGLETPRLAARMLGTALTSRLGLVRAESVPVRNLGILPALLAASVGPNEPYRRLRARVRRCVTEVVRTELDHADLERGGRAQSVRGLETLEALAASGQGAIVCSLHFGPFQYVGFELGHRGFPIHALMLGQLLEERGSRWEQAAREADRSVSLHSSGRASSLLAALRALRAGKIVVIYMDAHAGVGGAAAGRQHRAPVTFLSLPLAMRTGPAWLAQRVRAPVIPATAIRDRWGRRIVEFGPAFPPPGDEPDAVATFTQRLYDAFEPAVRKRPDQWAGWLWPVFHWGATGAAPTVTADQLRAERERIAALLRARAGGPRLRASPARVGFTEVVAGEWVLFEAAQRRFLAASPLTCALLRAGYRGVRVTSLPRRLGADPAELGSEIAKLTLAGLATVE